MESPKSLAMEGSSVITKKKKKIKKVETSYNGYKW